VFLFDEPLSNLDAALRVKMRLEFAKLHDDLKTTMIYVTHDQIEAMTLADKIVVLSEGRIEQVGSPQQLYHHPANRFVAGFIGSPKMNFIDGTVAAVQADGVLLQLPGGGSQLAAVDGSGLQPGEKVTLGVRPEHLNIAQGQAALQARFTALELLGDFSYLYAAYDGADEALILRVPDSLEPVSGSVLGLATDPARCHLFRQDGRALPRLTTGAPVQH